MKFIFLLLSLISFTVYSTDCTTYDASKTLNIGKTLKPSTKSSIEKNFSVSLSCTNTEFLDVNINDFAKDRFYIELKNLDGYENGYHIEKDKINGYQISFEKRSDFNITLSFIIIMKRNNDATYDYFNENHQIFFYPK